jgi:hypothetical protein
VSPLALAMCQPLVPSRLEKVVGEVTETLEDLGCSIENASRSLLFVGTR